jgi:cytidylate kinase
MKKDIITITGLPGSGKSSAAKGVARALGYDHVSSGDLFRKMAADRGLSVEAINIAAETQKEIDLEVDKWIEKLGRERSGFVIDSRIAFHWIPESFKVFLDLDLLKGAERTFAQIQREGRTSQAGSSVEEIYQNTVRRLESEKKRYWDLYAVDYTDTSHFNLVVDTGKNDLGRVIDIVVHAYTAWQAQ